MNSKATKVYEWERKDEAGILRVYRLIEIGARSKGYDDAYVLESRDTDTLGDPKWVKIEQYGRDAPERILIGALRHSLEANRDLQFDLQKYARDAILCTCQGGMTATKSCPQHRDPF